MKEKLNRSRKTSRSTKGVQQLQKQSSYGIPPWKMGAAFLSRPLFRVFPLGDSVVRIAAKFGSSVTVRLRELTEGLDTSN